MTKTRTGVHNRLTEAWSCQRGEVRQVAPAYAALNELELATPAGFLGLTVQ